MQDLLLMIEDINEEIKMLKKDEENTISNVISDLNTQLESKQKEINEENVSLERKFVLEDQIGYLQKNIERNKNQISVLYNTKIVKYKDSFNHILEGLNKKHEELSKLLLEEEEKLELIKNDIRNATNNDNFLDVKQLSEKADILLKNIVMEKKNINNIYMIKKELNDNVNQENFGNNIDLISQLLEEYKDKIARIKISSHDVTNIYKTSKETDEEKLKEKLKNVNELLDKAEKNLDDIALEEALKLIDTLSNKDEKDELNKKANEIKNKNKEIIEKNNYVNEKVKEIEDLASNYPIKKGTKLQIKEAYNDINLIDNSESKATFLKRLDTQVINITKKFMNELERLEQKIDNNEDITEEEITNLRDLYVELYKDEIKEIGFYKNGENGYAISLDNLIENYNVQAQSHYKQNKEIKKPKEDGKRISLPFNLKQRILESGSGLVTNFIKKGYKYKIQRDYRKLEKYKSEDYTKIDKSEKIAKYQENYQEDLNRIREFDIVSNGSLMVNKNNFEKLKNILYKKGISGLTQEQNRKYNEIVKNISQITLKGLTKITKDKEVTSDKLRVKTIISQYLQLLCIAPFQAPIRLKWNKRANEMLVFEKTKKDAIKFIKNCYGAGSITKEDFQSYMFTINSIDYYRKENNYDIYEMRCSKNKNGNEVYVDIDGAKSYYNNPVKYNVVEGEEPENMRYILPKRR